MTRTLRIASFNLESLEAGDATALDRRIAALAPRMDRLRADILCLQEVCAEPGGKGRPRVTAALDRLLAATAYAGFACAVTRNRAEVGPAERHNLALVSRYPITEASQLWHGMVPPPDYAALTASTGDDPVPLVWDRPVQTAEVVLPGGQPLHVFNLHLRAPRAAFVPGQKDHGRWRTLSGWAEGFFIAAVKRAGQALEARLAVEGVFDRDLGALIAVCGDLNADDREVPLRLLRGDGGRGTAALGERLLTPVEASVPDAQRYSVIYEGRRLMLDHILASPRLLAGLRDVTIDNADLEESASGSVADSDHAPLVAEFALDG